MLKQFFNLIFSKQANQVPQEVLTLTIKDNGAVNNDFEIAEMSFVGFAKLAQKDFAELEQKERRKNSGASLHNTLQEAGVCKERRGTAGE